MTSQSPSILTIPPELCERIISFCHPIDLIAFSKSCHSAHNLVYHPPDQYLWRHLFLFHPFDDPRNSIKAVPHHSIDWQDKLLQRMKVEFTSSNASVDERKFALETFISVVHEASQFTQEYKCSGNLQWLERVLRKSRMLDASPSPNEAALQARLRSYVALSIDDGKDEATLYRLKARRNMSRSYVYNLRNYRSDNEWGPYTTDGGVNWIHVECLINVVLMNLRELPNIGKHKRPPTCLEATRPYSAPGDRSLNDWAGIEGTWRRYVCFMDYRDLFAFNYADVAGGPRDPSFFDDPQFGEATRLIELKLHIVDAMRVRFPLPFIGSKGLASGNCDYPPLFFSGSANGVNGNEAIVEGFVHMDGDGVVRWRFVSIYDGHTQWSSDGVQVGNVGSALGIVGNWTTAHHDQGDPVGPFWLWKVDDDIDPDFTERLNTSMLT